MLYIFSDESGRFNNKKGKYYVRSSIFLTLEDLEKLNVILSSIIPNKFKRNIKWNTWKQNINLLERLFSDDIKFEILISLISIQNFLKKCNGKSGSYKFIQELEAGNLDEILTEKERGVPIKDKLLTKTKAVYFLNYWEFYCLENLKQLITNNWSQEEFYALTFHCPQMCNYDEYKQLVKGTGLKDESIQFISGDENIGIGIADIISGCVRELLEEENNMKAQDVYENLIRPRLARSSFPTINPGTIYFNDIEPNERLRIRSLLSPQYENLV